MQGLGKFAERLEMPALRDDGWFVSDKYTGQESRLEGQKLAIGRSCVLDDPWRLGVNI